MNIQNPPQQNQLTLDKLIEMINNTRDDILRKQSDSNTTTITGYDGLTRQFQSCIKQLENQEKEIVRLQELCKGHKIDYAIPPPAPVVMPTNEAVIPPQPATQELPTPPVVPETSKE